MGIKQTKCLVYKKLAKECSCVYSREPLESNILSRVCNLLVVPRVCSAGGSGGQESPCGEGWCARLCTKHTHGSNVRERSLNFCMSLCRAEIFKALSASSENAIASCRIPSQYLAGSVLDGTRRGKGADPGTACAAPAALRHPALCCSQTPPHTARAHRSSFLSKTSS